MNTVLKNPTSHNHENHEEVIKAENFQPKLKKQQKKILQNLCKKFTMKLSEELKIHISRNVEKSNQTFLVEGPGIYHQIPEVCEQCITVGSGNKIGSKFLLKKIQKM